MIAMCMPFLALSILSDSGIHIYICANAPMPTHYFRLHYDAAVACSAERGVKHYNTNNLRKYSVSSFYAIREVLSEKDADKHYIRFAWQTLGLLSSENKKVIRKMFYQDILQGLRSDDSWVRYWCVSILGNVASVDESAILIAMLYDSDSKIVISASQAISSIGQDNDLVVFDIWLHAQRNHFDETTRQTVIRMRNALARRLGKPTI